MIKFILRTVLTALAFLFILPHIPGIDFHGNFGIAVVAALLFALMGLVVDFVAIALAAMWTISSFGLALLILIPLWLIGFWIVPAVVLEIVSNMMPTHLTVNGWIPAIEGGLVLLVIGMITSTPKRKRIED
jgi:uncharacterized membrane protein YvlD (DUF360 family)